MIKLLCFKLNYLILNEGTITLEVYINKMLDIHKFEPKKKYLEELVDTDQSILDCFFFFYIKSRQKKIPDRARQHLRDLMGIVSWVFLCFFWVHQIFFSSITNSLIFIVYKRQLK